MLFAVANDTWEPGSPLLATETRTGLYRTRREALAIAGGRRLLAVAIQYDPLRGLVTPTPPAAFQLTQGWSAPAVVGTSGGVTALATIPACLVHALGPARLHMHEGHRASGFPHLALQEEAVPAGRRRC